MTEPETVLLQAQQAQLLLYSMGYRRVYGFLPEDPLTGSGRCNFLRILFGRKFCRNKRKVWSFSPPGVTACGAGGKRMACCGFTQPTQPSRTAAAIPAAKMWWSAHRSRAARRCCG